MQAKLKAIIGLGNPETKYNSTRHNTGFIVVDKLLQVKNIRLSEKFKAFFGKDGNTLFLLPTTYMNLSGESVIELVNFYKLRPEDLLVIYDDISLELGTLRFRKDGSDGGHNGIKSIIKCLSSNNFHRLKVGIGPKNPNMDLAAFVLQKFSKEELEKMNKTADIAKDAALDWLTFDMEHLQSKYNKKFF